MTKTIIQIEAEIEATQTLLRNLREERSDALIAACPHKVGDVFTTNGREYRVQKVSPGAKGATVYLHCFYKVASKRWSIGTKLVSHEVIA
jgi:hypothetical protein